MNPANPNRPYAVMPCALVLHWPKPTKAMVAKDFAHATARTLVNMARSQGFTRCLEETTSERFVVECDLRTVEENDGLILLAAGPRVQRPEGWVHLIDIPPDEALALVTVRAFGRMVTAQDVKLGALDVYRVNLRQSAT